VKTEKSDEPSTHGILRSSTNQTETPSPVKNYCTDAVIEIWLSK